MFSNILFPTDFSEYSQKTLEYVWGLKNAGLKKVILVHVIRAIEEYPVTLGLKDKAKTKLRELEKLLKKRGIKVESRVEMGNPYREILRVAEAEKVSLIVTGSHGKGLAEEILIGSVSERIAREAKVPVLVVRYKIIDALRGKLEKLSAQSFRKVLYPTDFSVCSHRTFDFVKALKKAGTKEVVIAHVVDDRYLFPYRAKVAKRESQIKLQVYKKELEERGIKAKIRVPLGAPVTELLRLSEEENVSLIALGSHGKGYLEEMVLGSVSENVIRRAKRPVLVVHERDIFEPFAGRRS